MLVKLEEVKADIDRVEDYFTFVEDIEGDGKLSAVTTICSFLEAMWLLPTTDSLCSEMGEDVVESHVKFGLDVGPGQGLVLCAGLVPDHAVGLFSTHHVLNLGLVHLGVWYWVNNSLFQFGPLALILKGWAWLLGADWKG